MKDLVCLVADKNMEATVGGLLARPQALGIRLVAYDLIVHPRHDPGCFYDGCDLLGGYRKSHAHALMMLDRAWDGAPASTGPELKEMLTGRLQDAGFGGWAEAMVLDPELEVWVFSDSPHVAEILGWSGRDPDLRAWLQDEGLWPLDMAKPPDPKVALERVLYETRKPRSSAIYRALAKRVSLDRCRDWAFLQLRGILKQWFHCEEYI